MWYLRILLTELAIQSKGAKFSCTSNPHLVSYICEGEVYSILCDAANAGYREDMCSPDLSPSSEICYHYALYEPVCCGGELDYSNTAAAACDGFFGCSPGMCFFECEDGNEAVEDQPAAYCGLCDNRDNVKCIVKKCKSLTYKRVPLEGDVCTPTYFDRESGERVYDCEDGHTPGNLPSEAIHAQCGPFGWLTMPVALLVAALPVARLDHLRV